MGRIDRLDTKFIDLFYFIFVSHSVSDLAIRKSLVNKKSFNERKWLIENEEIDGCLGMEL